MPCSRSRARAYPTLDIPFHARWRHFVVDGVDRWAQLADAASWPDRAARARAEFDLAIVSVLLDAGAGAAWRYRDAVTRQGIGRSEGLALASLDMFASGAFLQRCARSRSGSMRTCLQNCPLAALQRGFQVSDANPLVGLEGRADLLRRLGQLVAARRKFSDMHDTPRPGGLFDHHRRAGEGRRDCRARHPVARC